MQGDRTIEGVLLSAEQIAIRVRELGAQITADYKPLVDWTAPQPNIMAVGILKGVVPFYADLVRAIDLPIAFDFMAVSSYGAATATSGTVRILKDLDKAAEDRHLLVVEDIVDTGLTLSYLKENLLRRNPLSLKIVTLLNKPERRKTSITPDYNGFEIPDVFVVGYGLDCGENYRNLPYIGIIRT